MTNETPVIERGVVYERFITKSETRCRRYRDRMD